MAGELALRGLGVGYRVGYRVGVGVEHCTSAFIS